MTHRNGVALNTALAYCQAWASGDIVCDVPAGRLPGAATITRQPSRLP